MNIRTLPIALIACFSLTTALQAADTPPRPQVVITTNHGAITAELYPDAAPQTVEIFLGLASGERAWKDPTSQEMVRKPYYDGTTFHRVIPGFMIQGGDPLGNGSGGAGFSFADEFNGEGLGLDKQFVLNNGQLHPHMAYMQPQLMTAIIRPRLEARGLGPQSPQETVEAAFAEIIAELEGSYTLLQFYQDLGYSYDAQLATRRPIKGALAMANRGPNTNSGQFFINLVDTLHLSGKHTVFGQVVDGFAVVETIAALPTNGQDQPTEAVIIESIRLLNADAEADAAPSAGQQPATESPATSDRE